MITKVKRFDSNAKKRWLDTGATLKQITTWEEESNLNFIRDFVIKNVPPQVWAGNSLGWNKIALKYIDPNETDKPNPHSFAFWGIEDTLKHKKYEQMRDDAWRGYVNLINFIMKVQYLKDRLIDMLNAWVDKCNKEEGIDEDN